MVGVFGRIAPVHEAVPASGGAALKTVLVMEDDPSIQEIVQEHLQEAGYGVVGAWDAGAAIAILEARQDIHLVFTNIDMPGSMDGLKLAAAVRDRWPPVHLVITSGGHQPPGLPTDVFYRNIRRIRCFDGCACSVGTPAD